MLKMARVITDLKRQEPSYETFSNEEEHPDKIKYVNKLSKDGKFALILRGKHYFIIYDCRIWLQKYQKIWSTLSLDLMSFLVMNEKMYFNLDFDLITFLLVLTINNTALGSDTITNMLPSNSWKNHM